MTQPDPSPADAQPPRSEPTASRSAQGLEDTLRWAFELDDSTAMTGATWLTREIVPSAADPWSALLDASTTLAQLEELKNAYKMLRTTGTSAAERSLAARLYAATIGAALVRNGALISRQKTDALVHALSELHDDESMPAHIRDLAVRAIDAVRTRA